MRKGIQGRRRDMSRALVIFSGGLDSTVALYWARKQYDYVEALSFEYGSKHNEIEYNHALKTCFKLNIPNTRLHLDFMRDFKSSLINGEIPTADYNEENMKSTVVPFRNGIMLAIATGYAESNDFDYIILGNHAGDHDLYPDCREDFTKAMQKAIKLGTYKDIEFVSRFCNMSKADIVKLGSELNVDFSLTYSCYKGREKHCGLCGTCRERKQAFKDSNIKDITEYEA